jgi:hypothetical protein
LRTLLAALVLCYAPLFGAQSTHVEPVLKIFIDRMPNDFDQYLRAEFSSQMKARIVIVAAEKDADATITSLDMVNKDHKVLLWSDDAGDKMILFKVKAGEERKVAEHLVSKLRREINKEAALRN